MYWQKFRDMGKIDFTQVEKWKEYYVFKKKHHRIPK